MTSREFCYWLQGFFELASAAQTLAPDQVDLVRKHLAMVFKHEIDPSYPEKEALDALHNPKPQGIGPHPSGVTMRC